MSESAHEWHCASLVVRHRADALPAIALAVEQAKGLEIALRGETSSVLLQESEGTAGLMDNIALVEAVPGVYAVNLIYHHIEPQAPDGAGPAT